MDFFIRRCFFPLALMSSLIFYSLWEIQGWNKEFCIFFPNISFFILAYFLEKKYPYRKDWSHSIHEDTKEDWWSFLVAMLVSEPFIKSIFSIMGVYFYAQFGSIYNGIQELSLWWQVLIVLLVWELGAYIIHFLHHKNTSLWWLHAFHHSSKRLYSVNQMRVHPLNHMLSYIWNWIFIYMLMPSPDAIYWYIAISQPILMLQHTNLNFQNGILNFIFSTNEVHRWHHANKESGWMYNFGKILVIWDMIFGTYRNSLFTEKDTVWLFDTDEKKYPTQGGYFRKIFSKNTF